MVFKIKSTMTIEIENEIEADSLEEARQDFFAKSVAETVDDATRIEEISTEIDSAEVVEATFKVRVTSVDYDVDYGTVAGIVHEQNKELDEDSDEFDEMVYAKIDEIKKSLPQEMELEITCEKEDLDYYVDDAISEGTNWLTNYSIYEIIATK